MIMGSNSDWPKLESAEQVFQEFGVDLEVTVASAHRTPELVKDFAEGARDRGVEVIISAAGAAAHLGGVVASYTTLPVIGVPINATALNGMDALLSTVQMPSGIPVATMAIDGAKNAAIFAVQILSLKYPELVQKLAAYRAKMKEEVAEIDNHLAHIVDYTVNWYQMLKNKYGKNFPRRTELRNFDTIEAAKVVEANEKLYINREEGFIGTALKKDEFVANCSDIDDVIVFFRDGKYIVTPVADKKFVGKNILYVNVFKKNDKRTIYNITYRDGKEGTTYIKRFAVTGVVRDREYDVTQGTPDSRITYFSANPNGEAEIIKVTLKPNPRVRRIIFERDFSEISIKGRQAQGVILTRLPVHKIALKQKGGSTLGGRKVWFDRDILRLNYDGRGEYQGEFLSDDTILVVLNNGEFYTTNFDLSNHYEDNVSIVEKFDPNKIWTAALYDADQQNYPYLKRFCFEGSNRKQNYLGENKDNRLILLTDEYYPRLEVIFGGHDNFREPLVIDADEFIAVKGFKAKGKRLTTYTLETINELEPTRQPEVPQTPESNDEEEVEILDPDHGKSESDILDELTGQMKLFSDNDDSKEHETT